MKSINKIILFGILFLIILVSCKQKHNQKAKATYNIEKYTKGICMRIDTIYLVSDKSQDQLGLINESIEAALGNWRKEESKIPEDRKRDYLKHILLLDCDKYRGIDTTLKKDSYLEESFTKFPEIYVQRFYRIKNLLILSIQGKDSDSLNKFFLPTYDQIKLNKDLNRLQNDLGKIGRETYIEIFALPKSKIFRSSFIDVTTGLNVYSINFQFDSTREIFIQEWVIFDRSNLDPIDIKPGEIPPPPPPP